MKRVALLLVSLLFLSLAVYAQDTASLVGTVMDSTGAVIPNAKVTVQNPEKGFTRDLKSNSAGDYTIFAIPLGNYVVTAEAPGFQKLVRSGIVLQVGQVQRVDLTLQVGQATQEVTVTGNVPKVQTETAAISDVVTGAQISNLELNGRNFVTLALLVPGAAEEGGNFTSVGVYGNNNISFNGSRTQYNNWELDGGNNTDEGSASTLNTYPNLDTIAEFRISTSNYGADMGKHAGATIEVATKSGTKTFHGDGSEYLRRDWMDANPWELNRQLWPSGATNWNAPKAALSQQEYGYTFGGPIYIPGHFNTDKSKTFFYWSEDWRKIKNGQSMGGGVVSTKERGGDFSECDPNLPGYQPNYFSGCALPKDSTGKQYDTVQAMPGFNAANFKMGKELLDAYVPLANNGPVGWTFAAAANTNWRQEQIRVDENLSDKTSIFVRYTQDAWNTLAVPSLWNWASYDTVKTPFGGPGKSAVLHITHSFAPTLMNEFILSYTVDHILLYNQAADSVAGSIERPSDFTQPHFFAPNNGNTLLPDFVVCGNVSICAAEEMGNHPWFNSNPIPEMKDNVAWIHGKHTIKFGFFLEKYRKNEQYGSHTQGLDEFAPWGGGQTSTNNGLADVFFGNMQQYDEGSAVTAGLPTGGYPKGHWHMTDFEPYINDDFKVSPKLTINLGLRYYFMTRIHDTTHPTIDSGFLFSQYSPAAEAKYDNSGNLIQGTGSTWVNYGNGLVECGSGGVPNSCQLNNTGKNFAPRFGFAYDPWGTGKTVIRGGYGIYFESGNGNEAEPEGGEGNPPSAVDPTNYGINGFAVQPVFVGGKYMAAIGPGGFTAWPYNQKWPTEQQYSLGIQHEFKGANLVSVEYVGMLGRHLARFRSMTQPYIGLGTVNVPQLANTNGSKSPYLDASGNVLVAGDRPQDIGGPLCDANGNCNAQEILIYQEKPRLWFQPYPGWNSIGMKELTAVSSYNALQGSFRHAFGHGLTVQAAYTWSHALDDSSSTYSSNNNSINDYNMTRFKGTSDLNRSQVLNVNYIYELPFFKNGNSFVHSVFGGWTISGISSFYTGRPITIGCGPANFSDGAGTNILCNTSGPVKIKKGVFNDPVNGPTATWYDPSVMSEPTFSQLSANGAPGMFGYEGRNDLTGPGRNNTDLALLKNFQLPWFRGEHSTIQLRWETFNTFNHNQWSGINAGCDGTQYSYNNVYTPQSIAFGRSCQEQNIKITDTTGSTKTFRVNGGQGQVNGTYGPRIMQLGMKFIF